MRKLLVFVVLALFAVVPAFAQEATPEAEASPTIADIVVSSTSAETPEFTTLLAAVQAADPAFLEALSDPEGNVTVFAPTDAAFAAALESLNLTAEELLGNTDLLNTVLAYHVVPGTFDSTAVVGLNGALLGTTLRGEALAIAVDGDAVTVNGANVVAVDVAASNGIVHVIDAVLVPPMGDEAMAEGEMMEEPTATLADTVIASTTAETPEFTTLLAAVQAADPSVLDELTNGGPYTVFAPTDAAFAAALEALGVTAEDLLADTETLTGILAYHVVPGYFTAADVVAAAGEAGFSIATLAGTPVTIMVSGESVMVNEATVVATDVMAANGIVHVIDSVLLPPTE